MDPVSVIFIPGFSIDFIILFPTKGGLGAKPPAKKYTFYDQYTPKLGYVSEVGYNNLWNCHCAVFRFAILLLTH